MSLSQNGIVPHRELPNPHPPKGVGWGYHPLEDFSLCPKTNKQTKKGKIAIYVI